MTDDASTLTPAEIEAAKLSGMSEAEYRGMKSVRSGADFDALQQRLRDDAEHEKLKAAIHKALDERDAAA
jgi:hypothetical protein